ncbi:hypothetical protein DOT_4376 [Desulfosporosinus sp. OT]|nr:hypothetical protein DOT_4376 [Desulfosporosinus sp. OT]
MFYFHTFDIGNHSIFRVQAVLIRSLGPLYALIYAWDIYGLDYGNINISN